MLRSAVRTASRLSRSLYRPINVTTGHVATEQDWHSLSEQLSESLSRSEEVYYIYAATMAPMSPDVFFSPYPS